MLWGCSWWGRVVVCWRCSRVMGKDCPASPEVGYPFGLRRGACPTKLRAGGMMGVIFLIV